MANCRFLGHAEAVAQVQRATMSGTWANNDTATVTINGKDVTYTNSTGANNYNTILTGFAAALNASTYQEFAEITWANSSNTDIQGTSDTLGTPFVATNSEVTAGNGALGDFAATTNNEGPNSARSLDNWSTGALPTASDDVVFEDSDVDCLYDLETLAAVQPLTLTIKQSYTGKIGLPQTNEDATTEYQEYRTRYLQMGPVVATIGEGDGDGSGRIMLDSVANDTAWTVYNKGQRVQTGVPCVLLKSTNASSALTVIEGDVGVAYFEGETSNLTGGCKVGGSATVELGSGVTLGDIDQSGGNIIVRSNSTTTDIYGGTLTIYEAATATTVNVYGGAKVFDYSTGTFTTLNLVGEYNHSGSMAAKTITNASLYRGAVYRDPYGAVTVNNGLDLQRCKPTEVTIDTVPHKTWTESAI